MPAPLELLYRLRRIDETQPAWASVNYFETITGVAAQSVNSAAQGPAADKVWFITGVYLLGNPTGVLLIQNMRVRVVSAAVPDTVIQEIDGAVVDNVAFPAGISFIRTRQCDVVVVGGQHALRANFFFSAGNAANISEWAFGGYELPRGNVQLR